MGYIFIRNLARSVQYRSHRTIKEVTMTRSTQIREVYAELRHALGNQISAREALEAAASIVDLFLIDEEEQAPGFDLYVGGMPFCQWALDVAISDGGWRVLRYELEQARVIEEEAEWETVVHRGFKQLAEEAYA
jgi:hypothetical protein